MHVNKGHSVFTIGRVAKDLGEDEDWLCDVANGMDPEDCLIWVFGVGDDDIMAFTDLGIDPSDDRRFCRTVIVTCVARVAPPARR
nr:hypothetical protein [Bradyrhizobium australiense]